MENLIIGKKALSKAVADLLPRRVLWAVESLTADFEIEEIRLRRDGNVWVCGGRENLDLGVKITGEEIEDILIKACGGSVYSSADSIKKGYVFAGDGVRVGVCGEWTSGGVRKISSLAVRVPHRVKIDVSGVRPLLEGFGMSRGLLAFSPPLGGKTSFLREAARALSSGESPLRVVVVDTRGELAYSLDGNLCIDILSRYPRKEGIEIASRTMGAQVVVCDEIGGGEYGAISELHGGGVPIVASAHAAGLADLLSKKGISELHKDGVFGAYLELFRGQDPPYKCHFWEDCRDI